MKRDMGLIREILLQAEASPTGFVGEIDIDGRDPHEVNYHCYLIGDAGLAVVKDQTDLKSPGPEARIHYLTSAGHDFLDAAREPRRWQQARERLQKAGGEATIRVWTDLLTKMLRETLDL